MKQQTKELIEWIKSTLESVAGPEKYNEAKAFLDSIEDIESHLCRGGYIQDRNGIPCREKDKVKFCCAKKERIGTLLWNREDAEFQIDTGNDFARSLRNVIWFEKID